MHDDSGNLSIFSARIQDRVVPAKDINKLKQGGASGPKMSGGYDPVKDEAWVPIADNAYSRTIRLHESAHAILTDRRTRTRPSDILEQAIEDARIHLELDTTGSVRRDEVYTAAADLRSIPSGIDAYFLDAQNRALAGLILIRSSAILSKGSESVNSGVVERRLQNLADQYHPKGKALLDEIIQAIKEGDIDGAKNLASQLIANPPQQEQGDNTGKGGKKGGKKSSQKGNSKGKKSKQDKQGGNTKQNGKPSQKEQEETEEEEEENNEETDQPQDEPKEEEEKEEEEEEDSNENDESESDNEEDESEKSEDKPEPEFDRTKSEKVDAKPVPIANLLPKLVKKSEQKAEKVLARRDIEDGNVSLFVPENSTKGKTPIMWVHTLDANVPRRVMGKGKAAVRPVSQGTKIRTSKLALAASNPNPPRLFTKRAVGGTVLLDASGSMSISDASLYQIAEAFPAGKVAYYSGGQDSTEFSEMQLQRYEASGYQMDGDLVVYANNGKIRREHSKLPFRSGGNLVDYNALIWLMQQPAPRYIMTDVQFCGGSTSQEAIKLHDKLVKEKQITSFYNMAELMDFVKEKAERIK